MTSHACQLTRIVGRPYEVVGAAEQWLLYIQPSHDLAALVTKVAKHVAPRPCAARLRVYSELPKVRHVLPLSSASDAIELLNGCEAVGLFDSADLLHDQRSIVERLCDTTAREEDDEAWLLSAVQPRPVIFLHADHDDIDLVCGADDAQRLLAVLRQGA